ncbi:MAG: hypothetical protein O2955_00510 [Planctomycetota bacterium]|nr:hypothetical protein [Planctomycetota bacterium]MDA1210962.1 hypothetical protein [Planctomycetota bacterium]
MNDHPYNPIDIPRQPLFVRLLRWKVVIPLIVVCSIFTAPLMYRQWLLSQIPDIGDPFDVEAFGTVELADEENAKFDYEAAVAMLVPLPEIIDKDSPYGESIAGDVQQHALDNGWEAAAPEIQQWVEDNRPAMERWKAGTEKPGFLYYQPKDVNLETSFELYQSIREFYRLAKLESSRLLSEGEPEQAWIWSQATISCSRHFGQHGGIFERTLGMAIHAVGVVTEKIIVDDPLTSEALLSKMLAYVQQKYSESAANSTAIKWEYLWIKNSIHDDKIVDDWIVIHTALEKEQFRLYRWYKIEPMLSQLVSQQYVANVLDQIDLPLRERQQRTTNLELFLRDPGTAYKAEMLHPDKIERLFSQTIVLRQLQPDFSKPVFSRACFQEQARQYSLELCIALQIYHRRHDHYPATLDELVHDQILDEIPLDPFSPTGERMRYRLYNGEAYVWSIGENGVDDGGLYVDSDDIAKKMLDTGLRLGDSVEARKP